MLEQVLPLIIFSLGLIGQSILLIKNLHPKDVAIILLISLTFVGPSIYLIATSQGQALQEQYRAILIFITAYACLFGVYFRDKILVKIDEWQLLIWNMLLWYLFLSKFFTTDLDNPYIIIIYLILIVLTVVSLISLVFILTPINPSKFMRGFLYGWYLINVVLIGIAHIFTSKNITFDITRALTEHSLLTAFFEGMIFLYIAVHLWFIAKFFLSLIAYSERRYLYTLSDKFSDSQKPFLASLSILILLGLSLYFNYRYHLVAESLVIAISILAVSQLAKKFEVVIMKNK